MCSAPDIADPIAPTRYAQQRRPNEKDGTDAKKRAKSQRRQATATLLTRDNTPLDTSSGKTLLGM